MSNSFWSGVASSLKVIAYNIEGALEKFGTEIWHVVQEVFKAEEQVIMAQLFTMLKNDAISLQNAQPGISSKDMESVLKANAQTALVSLGATLAYTGVITVIGTVMHDLSVQDSTGNAGNVS